MGVLKTTLVGSFPLEATAGNIDRALRDQVEVGVDYPVLPQLRDFVEMYVDPLISEGLLEKVPGGLRIRQLSFSSLRPEVPWDLRLAAAKAQKRGLEFRLAVTGPFTIASSIALPSRRPGELMGSALTDKGLLSRLTEYVCGLAALLDRELRPYMVCIDEPILSVIVGSRRVLFGYSLDYIRGTLDAVLSEFRSARLKGVHVCSRLPPLLKDVLLRLEEAEYLDHEFSDLPENRRFYARRELENHDKFLSYGVISSKKPRIERVEEVYGLIEEAYAAYGERLLLVKPDCGFRGLRGVLGGREYEEIVIPKLRVLVEATRRFNARLEGKDRG